MNELRACSTVVFLPMLGPSLLTVSNNHISLVIHKMIDEKK